MKSKHIFTGLAALAVSAAYTSCSHDFDDLTPEQQVIETYNNIFIENFGKPADNQDWGFGAGTRGVTRAVFSEYWDGVHNSTASSKVTCGVNWTDTVQFTVPSGLVTVGANTTIEPGKNYYVPSSFNGKVKFADQYNGNIYVAGTVTGYEGGNQKNVNIYIFGKASWTSSFTSGTVTFYNNGDLILGGSDLQNSNISAIYNAGSFTYTGTNTNNSTYLYSTGTVELTADNVDFKLKCDVHNTMTAKSVKIQNGTAKYICGIKATGKVENVDGPLVTSDVIANELSFDGNPIYLTQGGHINVGSTLSIPNSNCHVYAVAGSTALVEAKNFEFANKNDFTHTFSDNIYFKVNGGYVKVDGCYAMGSSHYFDTVADYLAYEGHNANQSDEFALAKDRINAGNATGSPACGLPWSIGTPTPDDGEEWDEWVRIIAEDLSVKTRTDFDFNDVVFDARINKAKTKAQIKLKAAGGTLPLTVGWSGDPNTSYSDYEVHNMYGVSTNVMVNTQAKNGVNGKPDVLKTLTGTFNSYNDIKVMVQKMGEWMEIKANTGEPAAKILVKTTYEWCKEREPIGERYPKFLEYVRENPSSTSAWYENQ